MMGIRGAAILSEPHFSDALTVGELLDILNESFAGMRVAVRGEVSAIEERRGVTYFSLKDSGGEGMLSCLMFRSDFFFSGIRIEDGADVVVEGVPNVWKPRGRLSFRVSRIRLAGEGALKKAYDALREALGREGLFSPEGKRPLPPFPRSIAVITSKDGAALGDFSANLGRFGFSVSLFDAHVEGRHAIPELIAGIRHFNAAPKEWDVLVLIRGGGSLESLEAYNSELVVRAVAKSRIPTLAGIGHEKDISLAALAADRMVSTPTAAALLLGESWGHARERLLAWEEYLTDRFRRACFDSEERLRASIETVRNGRDSLMAPFERAEQIGSRLLFEVEGKMKEMRLLERHLSKQVGRFCNAARFASRLEFIESRLHARNPRNLLARGYSILLKGPSVVRGVSDLRAGEDFEAVLADGRICARSSGSAFESKGVSSE